MLSIMGTIVGSVVVLVAPDLLLHVQGNPPSILDSKTPIELCSTEDSAIEARTTVRIWNDRGRSSSGGSGTVVGLNGNRMLVLTCDHIYRNGIGRISIRRDGKERPGHVVARDENHDLSLVLTSRMEGPVATVHNRESQRGDRVTLSGFGGDNRPFMLRIGPARNSEWVGALSNPGDSGGGAFVDGKLIGVLVGHEKYDNTESHIIPLRFVYGLAMPVKNSRGGYTLYQVDDGVTLTGFIGRMIFGPRNGGKWKGKGQGYCGPGGCPPGFGGGGGGFSSPPAPGEPWYAPGFGPQDPAPQDPGGTQPAPPPENPPIVTPGPNPGEVEIDLSRFATKEEVEVKFHEVNNRIDEVGLRFNEVDAKISGLAKSSDIEIIVERMGNIQSSIDQNQKIVNDRFQVVEAALLDKQQPTEPQDLPKRHWVLVADMRDSRWSVLEDTVNRARTNGAVIITVDSRRIEGVVAVPQLVSWEDGRPQGVVTGQRSVIDAIRAL